MNTVHAAPAAPSKSILTLMTVEQIRALDNPHHTTDELECAICYKQITNAFFMCSDPCYKIFHTSCVEQSMDQTAETAYELDEEVLHKCCYCRRNININYYHRQNFMRYLKTLPAHGIDVRDALAQLVLEKDDDDDYEDVTYEVYNTIDITYVKKPKQSKRTAFNKNVQQRRTKMMPHAAIKQNIGGRRR